MDQDAATAPGASLGLAVGKRLQGAAPGATVLGAQLLPRCPRCLAPHPLARRPAVLADDCPDCGMPLDPLPAPVVVDSALTGRSPDLLLARGLLAVGALLRKWWERRQ